MSASGAVTHDFGSVSVNSSAAAPTFAFSAAISGVTSAPTWTMTGSAFSATAINCSVASGTANCSGSISFAPHYPGVQTGALVAVGATGTVLSSYFFRGMGTASQAVFMPGVVNTLAGNGNWSYVDGALASASFRGPSGIAIDSVGNLYVADSLNQVIRKITSTAVSTVAGNGLAGYSGDNGPATSATLNNPTAVALDAANNLYIADQGNNLIRRVDAVSGVMTTVVGGGSTVLTVASTGVAARNAALYGPQSLVIDPAGNLFIADSYHQMVLRVDGTTNLVTVFAGGGTGGGSDGMGDNDAATTAFLSNPSGIALDSSNNLYIADTGNSMIREVNASTGIITAVAGNGNYGYSGDSGLAIHAALKSPLAVRVDPAGNLYIADSGNNVVRIVMAASGIINTLIGTGTAGYSGDGGLASKATLSSPTDLVVNSAGQVAVVDNSNNVIRQLSPSSPALSFASTVVGTISPTQTVTVMNRGNQVLNFTGLTVSAGFKQATGVASCSAGGVIQAGGYCSATMEFAPVSVGSSSGTLSMTTNSLNASAAQAVGLSGIGLAGNAPKVTLSTAALNFGVVSTGTTVSQTVTVSNTGNAALSIEGISLTGSGGSSFSATSACGTSLAAGATCSVSIAFSPVDSVAYSALLALSDSANTSPQQVTLAGSGSGGPVGSTSASSLSFTSVVGTSSSYQSMTFSNSGTGTLNLTGITISGPNSGDFNISTNCGGALTGGQSCSIAIAFLPTATGARTATLTITDNGTGSPHSVSLAGTQPTALQLIPITPCRLADTRLAAGPFGGPAIAANVPRTFVVPAGACGIPSSAAAYSLNVTVVPSGPLGALSIWPAGLAQPLVSTLNSIDGRIKANAAIVLAGVGGGITVGVSQQTHVILDISGYFVAGNSSALDFYSVTPCRIADTRLATGTFGGPTLQGMVPRSFPILSSVCATPSTAQIYSLNFTAVPHVPLGGLITWPTGSPQPPTSTLNSLTGTVVANAALTQAGTSGAVTAMASNLSDLIIDINGYFAPPTSGGLSFYAVTPCRVLDTRLANGLFTGVLAVNVVASPCGVPPTARAFVLNATVVPAAPLGALIMWPNGYPEPLVSTLNSIDAAITSNMAIVPTTNGSINALASNPSQLVLDISGYFAP